MSSMYVLIFEVIYHSGWWILLLLLEIPLQQHYTSSSQDNHVYKHPSCCPQHNKND